MIGQTAETERRKGSPASARQWDEASVFQVLAQRPDGAEAAVARRILDWAKAAGSEPSLDRALLAGKA